MLKCKYLNDFGPEVIVEINTLDGPKEIIVHPSSIHSGLLDIRYYVKRDEEVTFVALIRETCDGLYGVHVNTDELVFYK